MGDFNIITKCKGIGADKLEELCDPFNFKNLVKSQTCFTKNHKSLIDLLLTNKPSSFQRTELPETGLSDYQNFITILLKCKSQCLQPKNFCYQKYQSFNPNMGGCEVILHPPCWFSFINPEMVDVVALAFRSIK